MIAVIIFLTSLLTLALELILTRVFDVIFNPNIAYAIITCAMFSFGLAGIFTMLRKGVSSGKEHSYIASLLILFALSVASLRPALNFIASRYVEDPAAASTIIRGIMKIAPFVGVYSLIIIPFFLSGLILITIFTRFSRHIHRLYFFDLVGAGIGCFVFIPFLPRIGPGGLLICIAGAALLLAASLLRRRMYRVILIGAGVLVIALPVIKLPEIYEFMEMYNKRGLKEAHTEGKIEYSIWDPISKIDIYSQDYINPVTKQINPLLSKKHIAYDGGSQSSHFFPFDGDLQSLRSRLFEENENESHFWGRGVLASHYVKRDSQQDVLIIGSAGGQETKAALMYNARSVDAVEMVGSVVRLGKGAYASYIGSIFNNPRVRVHIEEGRRFLNSSNKLYDIIQIFSNHTTSSIAAGVGAMGTIYLQTVEAYQEYFTHLKPNGILHINHHNYPRMISTASVAWRRLGKDHFKRHVIVFERRKGADTLPTFLIKLSPWTDAEITELREFFELQAPLKWEGEYSLVENPRSFEGSFLSEEFYAGERNMRFFNTLDYRAYPATDNQPYFMFLRRHLGAMHVNADTFVNISIAEHLNSQLFKSRIPMDIFHFFVIGFASLFFSASLIIIPFLISEAGRTPWPAKKMTLAYFSCLGAGFIIFELVLIHVFMKFIGYPLYCFSTVICTVLFAAGTGSFVSGKLGVSPRKRWFIPFIGILGAGILFIFSKDHIFDLFLTAPLFLRIFISVIAIFPQAFFMGMPFPLGISTIRSYPHGAIAWAWGMNSIFTVIGGFSAILLSIFFGFFATLCIALAVYGLGFVCYRQLRQSFLMNDAQANN